MRNHCTGGCSGRQPICLQRVFVYHLIRFGGRHMEALVSRAGRRVTLQDSVYAQLRSLLMRGQFDPGQTLIVQSLATTLQTSTMPVRGALLQLVSENALEVLPSGTTRVPDVSLAKLEDLRTARVSIEG